MRRLLPVLILALTVPVPLQAAEETPAVIKALGACRALTDGQARLACYDREAASLVQSVERQETVVLDKQEVKKTRRSLFGYSMPNLPIFRAAEKDKDAPEFTQIDTPIKTVRSIGYGRFRFTVDDGALWETTEGINAFPKPGEKVLIKAGLMGSYFIKFEGTRSVKGRRVG